jgi:hypothetical protein
MVYVCWPMWGHLHGICMLANVEPLTCVFKLVDEGLLTLGICV